MLLTSPTEGRYATGNEAVSIVEQFGKSPGQIDRISCGMQQSGRTRRISTEKFRKRPGPRGHHRQASRHGLNHWNALGLRHRCRHHEKIDLPKQLAFTVSIDLTQPAKPVLQSLFSGKRPALLQIGGFGGHHCPGSQQFNIAALTNQTGHRLNRLIESLLSAGPGQKANRAATAPASPPSQQIRNSLGKA